LLLDIYSFFLLALNLIQSQSSFVWNTVGKFLPFCDSVVDCALNSSLNSVVIWVRHIFNFILLGYHIAALFTNILFFWVLTFLVIISFFLEFLFDLSSSSDSFFRNPVVSFDFLLKFYLVLLLLEHFWLHDSSSSQDFLSLRLLLLSSPFVTFNLFKSHFLPLLSILFLQPSCIPSNLLFRNSWSCFLFLVSNFLQNFTHWLWLLNLISWFEHNL